VVFVADDLGGWLVGLLADAGRRRLVASVLGTDQERALRQAAAAAVQRTAAGLCAADAGLTGTGRSSSDVLGIAAGLLAETLAGTWSGRS